MRSSAFFDLHGRELMATTDYTSKENTDGREAVTTSTRNAYETVLRDRVIAAIVGEGLCSLVLCAV